MSAKGLSSFEFRLLASLCAFLSWSHVCAAITLNSGQESPLNTNGVTHDCDIVTWADSTGSNRTAYLVRADGVHSNDYVGGFITRLTYSDGANVVDAREWGHDEISGFGNLINHVDGGGVSRSKTEGYDATNETIFAGPHHLIWRVEMDQYADPANHSTGSWHVTVDYMFRSGDDYVVYAITHDSTSTNLGTFNNDSRSPYCHFDWDGTGNYGDGITGLEYGTDTRFICPDITNETWTYTNANTIPYVWEWKDSPDREIGFVQTQTHSEHTGGGWVGHGSSGTNLPPAWQLAYQMNGYGHAGFGPYEDNKISWGTYYGYVDGGGGSSDYYQNYSLCLVLDPKTRGGVTNLIGEHELIHGGDVSFSADEGRIVTQGVEGVSCPNTWPFSPAGYDHVYRLWRASATASNTVDLNLDMAAGALCNPTFRVEHYLGTNAPDTVELNGSNLLADVEYFASVDSVRSYLYLTLNSCLVGSNTVRVTAAGDHGAEANVFRNPGFLYSFNGSTGAGDKALYWERWGEGTRESWGSYDSDGYMATLHNWGGGDATGGWGQIAPAIPSNHYVFSGHFAADASYVYSNLSIALTFMDSSMGEIASSTTTVSGVGTSWTYYETEGTAPGDASWCGATVAAEAQGYSGTFKFDDLRLSSSGAPGPGLLEPEDGCLVGVNLDWGKETAVSFNAAVGWDHVCFVDFSHFPLSTYTNLDGHIGQVEEVGGVYVATLEPDDAHGGLAGISSNDCQAFAGWCSYWNGQGVPIIIRFAHEMNGDWYDWKMRPRTYREKFRMFADIVHDTATNTAMLWAPNVGGAYPYGVYENMTRSVYTNGYGSLSDWFLLDSNGDGSLNDAVGQKDDPYEPFYPGDSYVDWVGMTIYHWGSYWPWHYNAWPEQRKLFNQITGNYNGHNGDDTWNPNFYSTYADGHDKPMMIPETSGYYRPAEKADPGGYPKYTNDEYYIKSQWMEQVYNVHGDTANALDVADNFPNLKGINWFNQYKIEAEAESDWVNWTVTSNAAVKSEYYGWLNAMKSGKRRYLHADDLAGYVYGWNSSLEGWTGGGGPFDVAVSTNDPYQGRACVEIVYDDSSPPYGKTVMSDTSAMQDARSWSNHNAIYMRARAPTNIAWTTCRLAMQSAGTTWDALASTSCPNDGLWHNLVFPYAWTNHSTSAWLNIYLQLDLPTGATATVYVDGLQAVSDNDADGQTDGDDGDDDNDGMTDAYETAYGLDPNDSSDAALDPDADGHTNYEESRADTNPTNAASVLAVQAEALPGGEEIKLWWGGRSGVVYQVQDTDSLATGAWQDSGAPLTPVNHGTNAVTNDTASDRTQFYRLGLP